MCRLWLLLLLWPVVTEADDFKPSMMINPVTRAYRHLEMANTTGLVDLVSRLPLKVYEMKDDSVKGRKQLGVLGEDLEELVPAAVRMRGDFAVVDENAIFALGIGAVQELATFQANEGRGLERLGIAAGDVTAKLDEVRRRIEATKGDPGDEQRISDEQQRLTKLNDEERRKIEASEKTQGDLQRREQRERMKLTKDDERERRHLVEDDRKDRETQRHKRRLAEDAANREAEATRATDSKLMAQQLENDALLEKERRRDALEQVEAKAKAKAEAERSNEDIKLRALQASMDEQRKKLLAAIDLIARALARGATALFDDPRLLLTVVVSLIAIVGGGLFAREAAKLARALAEAFLGRPRLVRVTSRRRFVWTHRIFQAAWSFLSATMSRMVSRTFYSNIRDRCRTIYFQVGLLALRLLSKKKHKFVSMRLKMEDAFAAHVASRKAQKAEKDRLTADRIRKEEAGFLNGVVLAPELRERVLRLAIATRNAKKNRAPFRHVLLHGPPGTGKTFVARRLAKASGLEYALMSGGDVGPLGADGVTALHSLFRWARTSTTGVLLFVDEAEAFLASRARAKLTEDMRNALNAFLYQTGSPTLSYILVLATNRAHDLDPAVLDRIDETLYFDLPELSERSSLVSLYYEAYIASLAEVPKFLRRFRRTPLQLKSDLTPEVFALVAEKTASFSGREIEKLMVAVQSVAYANDGSLQASTLLGVVDHKVKEHQRKRDHDLEKDPRVLPPPPPKEMKLDDSPQKLTDDGGFLAELRGKKIPHRRHSL